MVGYDIVTSGRGVDHVAAASHHESSHGRVSLQKRPVLFDESSHRARSVANLKEWKHNRVKRANPAFCFRCLYCEVYTRHGVIFRTLPMKRGLILTGQLTC